MMEKLRASLYLAYEEVFFFELSQSKDHFIFGGLTERAKKDALAAGMNPRTMRRALVRVEDIAESDAETGKYNPDAAVQAVIAKYGLQ